MSDTTAQAPAAPAQDENQLIAERREKLKAMRQAQAEGKGVVLVDGRLVEALHVEEAVRVLAIAQQIAARDED